MSNNEQAAAAPQMVSVADFQALANELYNVRVKLERLSHQYSGANDCVDSLLKVVPPFSGDDMTWSPTAWEMATRKCVADFAQNISEHSVVLLLKQRLTGPAAVSMAPLNLDTLDKFFATLKWTFSAVAYSDLVSE
ncbi:hypothetical protein LPJ77_005977 [Coemansia sp. RSA 2523]|nr:hypothetical protein LPJ54_005923 [Coemansia sp. RSA 1824]KAJ1801850.1 hypothetical protein LPJ77_005977 [Coemansia sp. RSA 2523]KAJ2137210.1 hypothetical protein GGH17_001652 [Coemansia sp. RSA 788]KAJ2173482.1 hypothetical protein GGH16_001814 [Coemansia sp. RSA 560]KAJ2184870.1 hypothetical protein GGH18_004547 [Coemansia sp. RSA 530]KAJ2203241.1 hypothetical protein IW145_004193 [Coemansia sp. RSA 521]KAJ2220772.1 hypothetical protein IW143_002108 [Coemansia sp. RSA 520]KAJ2224299.1 h